MVTRASHPNVISLLEIRLENNEAIFSSKGDLKIINLKGYQNQTKPNQTTPTQE